jgi:hypothetical protein
VTESATYPIPQGQLSLSGPVARPAVGTLPIRGDLAHIALASRYLCAHYVVPHLRVVGAAGADLLCQQRDRFACGVVGQAEDREICLVERFGSGGGILAPRLVERDQREFAASGEPVGDLQPGRPYRAIDKNRPH